MNSVLSLKFLLQNHYFNLARVLSTQTETSWAGTELSIFLLARLSSKRPPERSIKTCMHLSKAFRIHSTFPENSSQRTSMIRFITETVPLLSINFIYQLLSLLLWENTWLKWCKKESVYSGPQFEDIRECCCLTFMVGHLIVSSKGNSNYQNFKCQLKYPEMSSTLTIRGLWHLDKIQYSLGTSEEDSHLPKGVSPFTLSKGLIPL